MNAFLDKYGLYILATWGIIILGIIIYTHETNSPKKCQCGKSAISP